MYPWFVNFAQGSTCVDLSCAQNCLLQTSIPFRSVSISDLIVPKCGLLLRHFGKMLVG